MRYTIPFERINTSGTINTFRTMCSLIMPNTGQCKAAIVGIHVGGSEQTPGDYGLMVRLMRNLTGVAKGSPGTTIAVANIPKKDNLSQNAPFTAGVDYSGGEPTYDGFVLWQYAFNARAGLMLPPFSEIIANVDQLIGLQVAPTAAAARSITGCLDIELR